MGKPRMLGRNSGFVPNSQADRRKVNRTFQHREYHKKVEMKKEAEYNVALERLNLIMAQCPGLFAYVQRVCDDIVEVVKQIMDNPQAASAIAELNEKINGTEAGKHGE